MYAASVYTRWPQAAKPRRPISRRYQPSLESLEDRLLLTAYWISPTGNDNNDGTTLASAWRTIGRVNQHTFAAGDRISFQGGASFAGNLRFHNAAMTPTDPITVTSYGTGRATILAGIGYGIFVYDSGGFQIDNLNLIGDPQGNTSSGILLLNDLPGNVELRHVWISNVDVSRFEFGVNVLACNGTSGYSDLRITYARLHHNLQAGLSSTGPFYCSATRTDAHVFRKVYVGHVEVDHNPGLPPSVANSSGSGIILGSIDAGVVERCLAHDNGGVGQGNVGIWVYNSNNVTIQHNESYRNRTGGDAEGGGFDIDFGTTNSVLQYNYAHDNDGQGFYIVGLGPNDPIFDPPPGPGDLTSRGIVVRYNVSERDARKNLSGGLVVYGGVYNSHFYNNTIFMTPNVTANSAAVLFGNFYGDNVNFRNNILFTTGGAPLVTYGGILTGTNVRFQGNDYWTGGGAFIIFYGATVYTDLAAWRASGQEMVNGDPVGLDVDPLLANPGGGGTVGDADQLHTLKAYRLRPASPLQNAGLDLQLLFGIDAGPRDFYGNPIPQEAAWSIGAHQAS